MRPRATLSRSERVRFFPKHVIHPPTDLEDVFSAEGLPWLGGRVLAALFPLLTEGAVHERDVELDPVL